MLQVKNNQLTFTDARYYTDDEGNYYPSVTTLLEAYPKPYALIQWMKEVGKDADTVRDAAGQRGSNVHHLTELYDMGAACSLLDDNGKPQYSLAEWAMFERYVDFSTRFKPEHLHIEQTILSPEYKTAGTIDRICRINGKLYILDIKTSNGIYNSYWLQVAAYRAMALASMGIEADGVAILWLNAKTRTEGRAGDVQGKGWQMVTRDDTGKDMSLFLAVQSLWLSEHEDEKPRNITYQISYKR